MAQRDVLIVANNSLIREVFHDIFLTASYECLLAADGHEGIEMFRGWRPSLVVTDLNLPVVSGMDLLQQVRQEDPDAAVIIVCGLAVKRDGEVVDFVDVESLRSACLKLGAYALLQKPIDMEDLLVAARRAIESRQIARRQRPVLERRWGAVRPMAAVSELLAVYGAVFAQIPRGLARRPCRDHGCCTPRRGEETQVTAMLAAPGTGARFGAHLLSRPSGGAQGQGWAVRCRWCGFSNRPGGKGCWQCGLPVDAKRASAVPGRTPSTTK